MVGGEIAPKVLHWFQDKRKISEKTLKISGIYSEPRRLNGDTIPKETIIFPYLWENRTVNLKFRNGEKEFGQTPGGMGVFWNATDLFDPRLQTNEAPLVVTEGEIDALTFIEIGIPVVSVPNGASVPSDGDTANYIRLAWKLLEPIKRIVLAADNDEKGRKLTKYLAEHFGEARCYTVTYPEGCKDANDVLQKFGPDEVRRLVIEAKHYPVAGLYSYDDLPPEPDLRPVTTGWGRLDGYLQLYCPSLLVVTGIPNAGKSKWVNQLATQVAFLHQWNIALASLEGRPAYTANNLKATYRELYPRGDTDQWLNCHFKFVLKKDPETNAFDLDWFLDKARVAIIRHNIKMFIIDPWNQLEHSLRAGETMTDYCGRAMRQIKLFAQEYEICFVIVVHPTKSGGNKAQEDINPYDIADSAHFYNQCDQCVIVTRIAGSYQANIIVKKVREQPQTGTIGMVPFTFDPYTETFSQ